MGGMHAHPDGSAPAGPARDGAPAETTIEAQATLAWLRVLRAEVRTWLAAQGVDATTSTDVVLGLSEAAANVVEHGYRGESGPISVSLAVHPDRVEVAIADDGAWHPGPSAPDRGRGLEIIGRLSVAPPAISTTDAGTRIAFTVERARSLG